MASPRTSLPISPRSRHSEGHRASHFVHLQSKGGKGPNVGKELGADFILEGSVQRRARRVRVTGQLINSNDGTGTFGRNDSIAILLTSSRFRTKSPALLSSS